MLNKPADVLGTGDALVIVDVQNDFCPGGALPIQSGDEVVPVLNCWIAGAIVKNVPIYASRDWHPIDHVSFKQQGGPWPPHCIQDSEGARFHPELQLPNSVIKITKGVRFDHDQQSVFDQTGLTYQLRLTGIKRLWVGGLAEDVCVLATVLDARRDGFEVVLIENATKPVSANDSERVRRQMREAGARFESAG
jgi:nicotinamidase/pyrazinamidase